MLDGVTEEELKHRSFKLVEDRFEHLSISIYTFSTDRKLCASITGGRKRKRPGVHHLLAKGAEDQI